MPEVPPQYQFAARISPLHTAVIGDATFVTPGFWSLLSVFIVPLPGFLGFLNRSGMAVNFAGTLWFSTVKQITELVSPSSESAHIKNSPAGVVFKLHGMVTFAYLVLASGILQLYKFSGNNIDCDYDGPDKKVLTYYCWISGATYVLRDPGAWNVAHEDFRRYGLGKAECPEGHDLPCNFNDKDKCETDDCLFYTKYYMWTPWVLIPAAFAYFLIRSYWAGVESGFMGSMVKSFTQVGSLRGSEEERNVNRKMVKELCGDLVSMRGHWDWIWIQYCLCHVANLALDIALVFVFDNLLGEFFINNPDNKRVNHVGFLNFGIQMFRFWKAGKWGENNVPLSPGVALFPRTAACKFQRFGSGGFGSTFVSVCFMNLNNVNEKVFLILWALLWLLISTSVVRIAYFLAGSTVCLPLLRKRLVVDSNCKRTRADMADLEEMPNVRDLASFVGLSPGLMFMLRTIGQNSRHDVYKEAVLQTLAAIRGERKATKKE